MSGSNFMALSNSDDERFQLDESGDDSPTQGHVRRASSEAGHFHAGHHSTAGRHF